MNNKNYGGRREGAGRPARDGATDLKTTQVVLGARHAQIAYRLGEGNVSLGIRKALDAYHVASQNLTTPAPKDFQPEVKIASENLPEEAKALLNEAAQELARGGHPKWVELIKKIDDFLLTQVQALPSGNDSSNSR